MTPCTADAHTLRRIHSVLHPGGTLWSGDIGKRECALWWFSFGATHFSLHDDEDDAAEMAVAVENGDECGHVYGVQFSDGRLVRATGWEALHRERVSSDARSARVVQELRANPLAKCILRDPFNGGEFTVTSTSPNWPPAWVGAPA
jgi:hypothetical protein